MAKDKKDKKKHMEGRKSLTSLVNHAELLKEEYIWLQDFYEDIDRRGLMIKNWSITVGMAVIGAAFSFSRKELFIIATFSALVFWWMEASWRKYSIYITPRIEQIESAFRIDQLESLQPLQIYNKWGQEFRRLEEEKERKRFTIFHMFKSICHTPHSLILLSSLVLYCVGIS